MQRASEITPHQMKLSLELENLIRSSSPLIQNEQPAPTLSDHLRGIDSRKALEVEHYLRACAVRLGLSDHDGCVCPW